MITIKKKIIRIICHRIGNPNDSKEREREKKILLKYLKEPKNLISDILTSI